MNPLIISLAMHFSRGYFHFVEKVLGHCRAQLRNESVPLRYRLIVALTLRNVRGYAPTVGVSDEHIMELLHFMQGLFHDLADSSTSEWAVNVVKYQDNINSLSNLGVIRRPTPAMRESFKANWSKDLPEPCYPHAGMSHGPCEQRKS